MNNFLDLDLTNVEADTGAPQQMLAVGKHDVTVVDAIVKENAKNNGNHLWCKFADADGLYVTEMYNINNPNPKAVSIGKAKLKAMLEASTHPDPNKPNGVENIKGVKLKIEVKNGKPKDDGTVYPEIKAYLPKGDTPEELDDEIPF